MYRLKTTFFLSLLTIPMVAMGSAIGGKSGMVFAFNVIRRLQAVVSRR